MTEFSGVPAYNPKLRRKNEDGQLLDVGLVVKVWKRAHGGQCGDAADPCRVIFRRAQYFVCHGKSPGWINARFAHGPGAIAPAAGAL